MQSCRHGKHRDCAFPGRCAKTLALPTENFHFEFSDSPREDRGGGRSPYDGFCAGVKRDAQMDCRDQQNKTAEEKRGNGLSDPKLPDANAREPRIAIGIAP